MRGPPRPKPKPIPRPKLEEDGGFLIPEVITQCRPGFWGYIARLFGLQWGYVDFRLADAIREAHAQTEHDLIYGTSNNGNPRGFIHNGPDKDD